MQDGSQCSGHGRCIPQGHDIGECTCESPWRGAHCEQISCPFYAMLQCAGAGRCVINDGRAACACDATRGGVDCSRVLSCDPSAGGLECSGHGKCTDGKCTCLRGYTGAQCQRDSLCGADSLGRECSGVGVCVSHACMCPPHHGGRICEQSNLDDRDIPPAPAVASASSRRNATS